MSPAGVWRCTRPTLHHAVAREQSVLVVCHAKLRRWPTAVVEAALHAAGCAKVYGETAFGARSDRPQLAKVLRLLREGDTLIVTRLDRLARSTRDLLNVLDGIAKKGAGFKSLADAWADTTTPHGRRYYRLPRRR